MISPNFSKRLQAVVDGAIKTAREILGCSGKLASVCILFDSHRRSVNVVMLERLGSDEAEATRRLKILARACDATDAIFISEAWMVQGKKPPGFKQPANFAEAQRLVEKLLPVPVAEHPARKEVVVFSVQSGEGRWSGHAPLVRRGKSATFHEVDWAEEQIARFDDVLPTKRN